MPITFDDLPDTQSASAASASQGAPITFDDLPDAKDSSITGGIWRGMSKRGVGVLQLADDATGGTLSNAAGKALGVSGDDVRQAAKKAAGTLEAQGKGTGISGALEEIAGDPLMMVPLPGLTATKVIGKIGQLAGQGAAVGGIAGATAPVAAGQNRADNIAQGLETGAALGPIGYGAGKLAGAGVKMVARPIAGALGLNTAANAENTVLTAISRDNTAISDLPQALDQNGKPLAIADVAGPSTLNLAGTVARTPGEGQSLAYDFLSQRQQGAPSRLNQDIDTGVSGDNFYGTLDKLTQQRKDAANKLYADAGKQGDFGSDELSTLLNRKPMQEAFQEAQKIAEATGDPAGKRFLAATPGQPMQQLINSDEAQLLKEGLDGMIEREQIVDPASGLTKLSKYGMALNDLRKQFLGQVDGLNPAFKQARQQYSGDTENMLALRDGRDVFNKDPEEIAKEYKSLENPPDENGVVTPSTAQAFYKTGVARALKDKVNSGSDTADLAARINRIPENSNRLSQIFSPDEIQSLTSGLNAEREMFGTKQRTFGGSQTSERTLAAENLNNEGAIEPVIQGAVSGGPAGAVKAAYGKLQQFGQGMNEPVRTQISKMLFSADPMQNQATVDALTRRLGSNAAKQSAFEQAVQRLGQAAVSRIGMEPQDRQQSAAPTQLPDPLEASSAVSQPQITAPLVSRIAQAESGGNPNAKNPNSSATGPLQFTNGTWAQMVAKYGKQTGISLSDKSNPEAQAEMGMLLAEDNAKALTKKLGRSPTDGELYMAHFLGADGATKLINAQGSGKQAIMLFPRRDVNANRSVFFDGRNPRSVEDVYALLNNKV